MGCGRWIDPAGRGTLPPLGIAGKQPCARRATVLFVATVFRNARRGLQHAEPADGEIVDLDR
jgi:hypothetical protein